MLFIVSSLTWWIWINALSDHGIAHEANETRYCCARIGRALGAGYTRDAVVGQEWPLWRAAARVLHAHGCAQKAGRIGDVTAASSTGVWRAAALTRLGGGAFTIWRRALVT